MYTHGNPIKYSDPSGYQTIREIRKIVVDFVYSTPGLDLSTMACFDVATLIGSKKFKAYAKKHGIYIIFSEIRGYKVHVSEAKSPKTHKIKKTYHIEHFGVVLVTRDKKKGRKVWYVDFLQSRRIPFTKSTGIKVEELENIGQKPQDPVLHKMQARQDAFISAQRAVKLRVWPACKYIKKITKVPPF